MAINAAWHARHPMPPNPTAEQRIAWHRAHGIHCGCRPIPDSLRVFIRRPASSVQPAGPRRPRRTARKRPRAG